MGKRIAPEDRVIAYFMSTPLALAGQMLQTVKAIVRQRTADDAIHLPKPMQRKRSRPQAKPRQALGQGPLASMSTEAAS